MTTNEEARDQWGETAEERHSRILTRDLAWLTYADECARDGVPRNERDHLIFNDGWAAAYSNITTLAAASDHQAEALDPLPYRVYDRRGDAEGRGRYARRGYGTILNPRPGYSQNFEDYE